MANFEPLYFINSSGDQVTLTSPDITKWFEIRGRYGFTAPEMDIITQRYANGKTKILKRQLKPRNVRVTMIVIGESTEERDNIFFEMVSKLLDVDGEDTGKLFVQRSDGSTVYLNCVYSSGLTITEEYKKLHRFTLEFFAPDSWFYKDLEDAVIEVTEGNFLTLSNNHLFGTHKIGEFDSSGSGVILNNSNDSLQPVIRLHNAVGSLTITNADTDYSININGISMTSGQTLVIDTRDDSKNIYIENPDGTTTEAGQYLEWNNTDYEFPIVSGENHISYTGSTGSRIESLTFSMSERYLSA